MMQDDPWREVRPLLDQELQKLPEKHRAVLVLCDLEGETHGAAAALLGCPVGTVSSRLVRAREILARRLARHGVTLSVSVLTMALAQQTATASVPTALVGSTVNAAGLVVSGDTAMLSANVTALVTGVLKAMMVSKLKILTLVVLAAAVVGVGAGGLFSQSPALMSGATQPGGQETQPTRVKKADTKSTSEFPYAVKFEQGATRFLNGDKITILDVRRTVDTFTPGNIYWIRGTYTLASHDKAVLAAYITAMDAADGIGPSLKVQSAVVNKGDGTFTLFLPMSSKGWPHVSFYPADGGGGFGGNYFGTGDSVMKKWWND